MCGRFALTFARATLERHAHTASWYTDGDGGTSAAELRPRYNVAPQQTVPVLRVRTDAGATTVAGKAERRCDRCLHRMRWGLVPWFSSSSSSSSQHLHYPINARSETLLDKPMFKTPLQRGQRCVLIVNGYYEWHEEQRDDKDAKRASGSGKRSGKTPYFIRVASPEQTDKARAGADDDVPMYLAALYGASSRGDSAPAYTFTIVTRPASAALSWLHDRMPAVLAGERAAQQWLDTDAVDADEAVSRLRRGSGRAAGDDKDDRREGEAAASAALCTDALEWFALSTEVSSIRNDRPQVLLPREVAIERSKQRGIVGMFAKMRKKQMEGEAAQAGAREEGDEQQRAKRQRL